MKMKGIITVAVALVAVAAVIALMKGGGDSSDSVSGEFDAFAKCLTDNGVVMYGAYWCPHCTAQKEMFGSSFKLVNSVECSLPNRGGQNAVCNKAGIKGYPTWEFSDKSMVEGEMTLGQLAEKSGCSLSE